MGLCYRTIYGQGADKSTYAGEGGGGGGARGVRVSLWSWSNTIWKALFLHAH